MRDDGVVERERQERERGIVGDLEIGMENKKERECRGEHGNYSPSHPLFVRSSSMLK